MEDIKNFLKEFLNEDRKAGLLLFFWINLLCLSILQFFP